MQHNLNHSRSRHRALRHYASAPTVTSRGHIHAALLQNLVWAGMVAFVEETPPPRPPYRKKPSILDREARITPHGIATLEAWNRHYPDPPEPVTPPRFVLTYRGEVLGEASSYDEAFALAREKRGVYRGHRALKLNRDFAITEEPPS